MDEIKRLTPAQRARCNRLIRRLCANYDGGNCLPLDDGEGCVCVQTISYSLLCKHFRRAVLPADKALYADIYRQRTRLCDRCGKPFGLFGERRNSGASEFCRLRRNEGYGACDDEASRLFVLLKSKQCLCRRCLRHLSEQCIFTPGRAGAQKHSLGRALKPRKKKL